MPRTKRAKKTSAGSSSGNSGASNDEVAPLLQSKQSAPSHQSLTISDPSYQHALHSASGHLLSPPPSQSQDGILTEQVSHAHLASHHVATQPHTPSISELTLLKPSTIKQGVLYIRTGLLFKSWRPYYCVLKNKALFYKKTQNSKSIAGFIDLRRTSVWDASKSNDNLLKSKHAFMIYHPLRKTYILKTDSEYKTKQWIKALLMVREMIRMHEGEEDNEVYTSSDDEAEGFMCCGWRIPLHIPNVLKHKGIMKEYIFNDLEKDLARSHENAEKHRAASKKHGGGGLFSRGMSSREVLDRNEGVARYVTAGSAQQQPQGGSMTVRGAESRITIDLAVPSDSSSEQANREKFMRLVQHIEEEYPELSLRVYGGE